MKKIIYLFSSLMLSQIVLADDTEIYGAVAISPENRVNSNVLFIMDTSGSMDEDVTTAVNDYDPNVNYSGSYRSSDIYNSLYDWVNNGHDRDAFESSDSNSCNTTLVNLDSEGRTSGVYSQKNWRGNFQDRLYDGSDRDIRCDRGRSYILYTGNYLNWYYGDNTVTSTRLDVVRDVVKDLTRSLTNINLGLMRFDRSSGGGMIDVPVGDIENTGSLIRDKLDSYIASGGTPLSETLYEGMMYYREAEWDFGSSANPNNSVPGSLNSNGTTYKTPIEATCQKNHIILLTDGEPTNDDEANNKIRNLVNSMTLPSGLSSSCSGHGGCLDELAFWARNSDHSASLAGNQEITTYTIGGFGLVNGVNLLTNAANWGGGKYFAADDTAELTAALDSIFLDILATDSTFTAPAVSVNAFNASEHRDELFYALFRPDDNIKWAGNLKRYKLTQDGIVVGQNTSTPAISEATGFFNEGVFDFWNNSPEADGKNVAKGGMANRFTTPGARNIYTENTSGTLVGLTSSSGATKNSFGMQGSSDEDFENVLNWTRGVDILDSDGDGNRTESRQQIGDPLHSEPVVITYGGTDENPDSTIYYGTNEGYLHAVDTVTGEEEFAFLPRALHGIQNDYYENISAVGNKPYGMDGLVTSWFYDKNANNILYDPVTGTLDTDEHVYLYSGMRRGGRGYYALDVTDRSNPKMLFKIEGGVTSGFEKLGQTWSRMTVAKVKYNGSARFVLFFTGGYDEAQDGNNTRQSDSLGNSIYMVDAETGQLLWHASNSGANTNITDMVNSMPASVSAIDITGEGYVDYLFAADTGGRVFRIDIKQNNAGASDFATGGMIADLAGDDIDNNRRFYNKPNVSLVKNKQYGDHLTISIGSGHRALPITTTAVKNRFYVIKDYSPYAPLNYDNYIAKTEASESKTSLAEGENADSTKLYNATALMTEGETALTSNMQRIMNNGGGWYVTFETEGEKVLAESTTFAGAIIFTTFSPSGGTSNVCGADTGASRVYTLGQTSAMSVIDLDGDGDVDANDSSKVLAHSGIAPRPVVIYRKNGGKTIAIGTETIEDDRFNNTPPDPDCAATNSCPENPEGKGNKYVIPQYWRQNEVSN